MPHGPHLVVYIHTCLCRWSGPSGHSEGEGAPLTDRERVHRGVLAAAEGSYLKLERGQAEIIKGCILEEDEKLFRI
jgi:hypothetical protein